MGMETYMTTFEQGARPHCILVALHPDRNHDPKSRQHTCPPYAAHGGMKFECAVRRLRELYGDSLAG
jgi:hypothetical protein